MSLPNMKPQELLRAAQIIVDRIPNGEMVKNRSGNLAILDAEGQMAGYVDLRTGEVVFFEGDEETVGEDY